MNGPGSTALAHIRVRPNLPPPLQELRHLVVDELVEPSCLLQTLPRWGARADGLYPLPQILLPARKHRVAPYGHLVPRVSAVDPVVVAPPARLPLPHHETYLRQIPHRIGDRRRTDLERLRKLRSSPLAFIGDEQRREYPGRHPRYPSLGEREREALHKPRHRILVTPIHSHFPASRHQPLPVSVVVFTRFYNHTCFYYFKFIKCMYYVKDTIGRELSARTRLGNSGEEFPMLGTGTGVWSCGLLVGAGWPSWNGALVRGTAIMG